MRILSRQFISIMVFTFSVSAIAQAPVTDLGSPRRTPPKTGSVDSGYPADTYPADIRPATNDESTSIEKPSRYPSDSSTDAATPIERGSAGGSSFNSLQQLQEEVATLRGQVEEQGHAIQRLKQQREDDMARMAGSNSPQSTTTGNNAVPGSATTSTAAPANNMTTEGKAEYESAYGKLKAKDYDGAITGFKSQIAQYPNSEYSGNAHFWLGFVYQTKGDSDSATKSFSSLIDKFPSHAKTPDAKYNLGKIYYQQGNTAKAKELLKDVASGSSKSAPLAKSYLESIK